MIVLHAGVRRAVALGAAIAALAAGPAAATTDTPKGAAPTTTAAAPTTTAAAPTTTTVGVLPTPTDPASGVDAMGALSARYSSLAGALVTYYATSTGMTLDGFVAANAPQLARLLGAADASSLSSLAAADPDTLTARLSASGLTLDTSKVTSVEELAAEVAAKANTLDGRVVAAGADYARRLGLLRTPELASPGRLDTSLATRMPVEGLAFGLFLDRGLAALVNDAPDVFAQVSRTGLGTPAQLEAWRQAMLRAGQGARQDFSFLPNTCVAGMLQVMASGDPASAAAVTGGRDCGTCAAGGLYLHTQMVKLFDPRSTSTLPVNGDGLIPQAEWSQMQGWLRQALVDQNPGLADRIRASVAPNTAGVDCAATSNAARAALDVTLPGVLGNLTKPAPARP